jgi:hypothetical protein
MQKDLSQKVDAISAQIEGQKERLEKIKDEATPDFKKRSAKHAEDCKNLTDDYNFLLDQYGKKLDGFSSRCYKDKIQINVWNRAKEITANGMIIPYRSQEELDLETQNGMITYFE